MTSDVRSASTSKGMLWTGRVVSALVVLMLLMDAAMKVFKAAPAVQGTMELGYPESVIVPIGVILLLSTLVYAFPRTSVLGAILLTGYLGGAVASNLRLLHTLLGYTLFPVYAGILVWGGLFLQDERLRALIPFRKP